MGVFSQLIKNVPDTRPGLHHVRQRRVHGGVQPAYQKCSRHSSRVTSRTATESSTARIPATTSTAPSTPPDRLEEQHRRWPLHPLPGLPPGINVSCSLFELSL